MLQLTCTKNHQRLYLFVHVEMLVKVTYSAYKRMILYYMMAMIYGEILKTGEKLLPIFSFLTFHRLFNADSKVPNKLKKLPHRTTVPPPPPLF